ncbi:HEAT repeat domain-containing protein, partial [Gemmatimonadota bacterium]
GREWAVRELGRFGEDPRVPAVLSTLTRQDTFWAVRLAAVETFAQVDPLGSVETLRAAANDASSRVRRAALRLLGERGDPTLIGFFRDRFTQDDSYQVQAEALRAVGRSGGPGQLPFLRDASRVESHQEVIRLAAEWAIQEITKRM